MQNLRVPFLIVISYEIYIINYPKNVNKLFIFFFVSTTAIFVYEHKLFFQHVNLQFSNNYVT